MCATGDSIKNSVCKRSAANPPRGQVGEGRTAFFAQIRVIQMLFSLLCSSSSALQAARHAVYHVQSGSRGRYSGGA